MTDPAPPAVLRRRARTVLNRLRKRYGELLPPRRSDPLEELVLTVLSQHTSDINAERAFESLRAAFPTWQDVVQRADPSGRGRDPLGRSRGHEGAAHPGDPARGRRAARRLRPVPSGGALRRRGPGRAHVAARRRPQDGGRRPFLLVGSRRDARGHARAPGDETARAGALRRPPRSERTGSCTSWSRRGCGRRSTSR